MGRSAWRRSVGSAIFELELLVNTGLRYTEILLVCQQPSLVGIFKRGRERGHDFPAVAQVPTDFCPLLALAHMVETTSCLDCLFQLVEVQRPFIDTRQSREGLSMLFEEFVKSI